MKKFYDKLLVVLAFLALVGGVVFYLLTSGAAEEAGAGPIPEPADKPYQPVPIPDPTAEEATWPPPEPQSSGPNWVYDVFTPPKIYLDADGNFTAEPPKPPAPPEPFGIYLAELKREPYRLQMQGFSGDRDKPEEAVLFFYDVEREVRFFIREGETNEEAEVEVVDFRIDSEIDAEKGEAVVTAIATILDKRSGEEIRLNDDEPLLNPEVSVVFLSEENPEVDVELTVDPADPGTSFETPAGNFNLQEINLEERTVTVKKQATEESEAKTRTLSPPVSTEPEPRNAQEETVENSPEEDGFDFDF